MRADIPGSLFISINYIWRLKVCAYGVNTSHTVVLAVKMYVQNLNEINDEVKTQKHLKVM